MAKNPRKTMNISLSPQMQRYVQELVDSGRYQSASEVMRDGLRLVQEHHEARLELARKIDEGLRDLNNGRTVSASKVMAEWRKRDAALLARPTRRRKSA